MAGVETAVTRRVLVERRVIRALNKHALPKPLGHRIAVVQLLHGVPQSAPGPERTKAGHVKWARLAKDVPEVTPGPERAEAAAIGSALRLFVRLHDMLKGTLRVRTLPQALIKGARRHIPIVVLVQIQAVFPIHAGTAKPVLAHLQAHCFVLRYDVALRTSRAMVTLSVLEGLTNLATFGGCVRLLGKGVLEGEGGVRGGVGKHLKAPNVVA